MRAKGWFVASRKMRAYSQWMGLTLTERRAITEAAA
ncbi:transposase, partial [Mycobacterium nebraskense]